MIKVQVNDKTYGTPEAVNIVLKRGFKILKYFTIIKSIIEYVIYVGLAMFIWWLSAYMHENDIIRECKAGNTPALLHNDVKVECKINDR